jgi:hypothetical protein
MLGWYKTCSNCQKWWYQFSAKFYVNLLFGFKLNIPLDFIYFYVEKELSCYSIESKENFQYMSETRLEALQQYTHYELNMSFMGNEPRWGG